jgi:hypothetical protein
MNDKKDETEAEEKSQGPILEAMKKIFSVGVGAAFLTEESIRSYLADLKLPKDALGFILQSANKGKEELVSRVSKEIGGLLSHIDIVKEASKFAENHKFKISAEIEVVSKNKESK